MMMATVAHPVDDVVRTIRARRFRFCTEAELQEAIARALAEDHHTLQREVTLTPEDRIDFIANETIGVEVKIKDSLSALTRQLMRYAVNGRITALVVVTPLARLTNLPDTMHGKPLRVVHLIGSVL